MKNLTMLGKRFPYSLKLDLKMKLTFYLFLISIFQIHANSYSQNTKISLELQNVSIENVLREIESKTEFKFLYNDNEVDYEKIVSVDFKKTRISKILNDLFSNTKINYEVLDKQIVLLLDTSKENQKNISESIQEKVITGTVIDDTGMPLPGASIVVKGTSKGASTDFDGNFSIALSENDNILIVSYIGYVTKEVAVGNKTTINITLASDAAALDEVVVIGYGTAKKSDVTGAVSQVTAKSFENQPLTRVENALQGRASGVTVAGSGAPGKAIKIRIRGVNSITGNNDPLVVVDGVFGGNLRTINPNNIASMEVLKDASALAIYGSRGSNGVILVTTKTGKGKAKVSVENFVTISTINKRLSPLSSAQFATLLNDESSAAVDPFSAAQIADFEANPINYQDLMFQTGFTNNTQVSLSGSTDDKLSYFVSGNLIDQKGTQITSNYKRYAFRSNLSKEFNDKFSVSANVTASREITHNDQDAFNGGGDGSSILRALIWDPTSPVRDENGEYIALGLSGGASNNYNPIRRLELSDHNVSTDRLNLTLNGKYKFTDNFSYTVIGSVSTLHGNTESYRVEGEFPVPGYNIFSFQNRKSTSHQISNILNWKKEFNKHTIDVTGVYEFQGTRTLNNGYSASDVPDIDNLYIADNGDNETFSNSGSETAIQSYLGRAQYNYDGLLYLTGSMRVDESSRFTEGNRTGYFPSGAVAVNLGKIDFIENSPLSKLKLRAGWGQVGNQNVNSTAGLSLSGTAGVASFDGTSGGVITGFSQIQEGNPDLKWETTTQTNVGIDFGFLNNRITGSVDYFNKDTKDVLLQTLVPGSTRITRYVNAGEVNNKGFDFSISANIIDTDDFSWNSNLNLSVIDNKVTKLYDGLDFIVGNANGIGGGNIKLNFIKVGEPLGSFRGFIYEGTWKTADATNDVIPRNPNNNRPLYTPGQAKFKLDAAGAPEYNAIGSGIPTTTFGFDNTFTYKNWDLNVFFNGSLGFEVYNQTRGAISGNGGNRSNLSQDVRGAWTVDNETELPRAGQANVLNSDRWVEKGDFVRLSNLKVGYTFDESIIKGISNLHLYASGQNLLLITDYSGYDPEVSSQVRGGGNADAGAGMDIGAFPNPVSFTIGVKASF